MLNNILSFLKKLDLKLVKVIDTHIHADHISGIAELRDKTNCVTVMGDKTPADVVAMQVADEETIKIDGLELQAIYTPGHTIESFSFLMNDRVFHWRCIINLEEPVEQIFKMEMQEIRIILFLINF